MAQGAPTAPRVLQGSVPGTERWLLCLRSPSFQRSAELRLIRAQSTLSGRQAQIAAYKQLVLADRAAEERAIVATGGRVLRHFWMEDVIEVEVAPSAVPGLRGLTRVVRAVPVQARQMADAGSSDSVGGASLAAPLPLPIGISTDPLNHNVATARTILGMGGPAYLGEGARVAVFDSGIDRDMNGGLAGDQPHPGLVDGAGLSRVEVHLQVNGPRHVDVNTIDGSGIQPYCGGAPVGYRTSVAPTVPWPHSGLAGHGTAMASIIAGNGYTFWSTTMAAGHAPAAKLIDVAFTSWPSTVPQSVGATAPWDGNDADLLGGVDLLWAYLLEIGDPPGALHVLNLSMGADPDPFHPAILALDRIAKEMDILVVACANNTTDTTQSSAGAYHALSVGAVHARTDALPAPNLAFLPILQTARGPLFSDHRRFYPDVCATGAGPGTVITSGGTSTREFRYPLGGWLSPVAMDAGLLMYGIDLDDPLSTGPFGNDVTPLRWRYGTSEAACQVSGAAALYRGFRQSRGTPATAEETRAAILLNVFGVFTDRTGVTSDPSAQHTYTNRNTFGVGYVRDDLLAEFAVRDVAIDPLAEVVTVSGSAPVADSAYEPPLGMGLTPGERYAVVACWQRYTDADGLPGDLPNVDLEVLHGVTPLARSATPANSYERLAFIAPASGQVAFRVRLVGATRPDPVQVQIVARKFSGDIDLSTSANDHIHAGSETVESVSSGSGCTANSQEWNVASILPTGYSNAYGSLPFTPEFGPAPHPTLPPTWFRHNGFGSGWDLNSPTTTHIQYCRQPSPGQPTVLPVVPHHIHGLAFRTWRPMVVGGDLTLTVGIAEMPASPVATGSSLRWNYPPFNAIRRDTFTLTLQNPGPQGPMDFNDFSVVAPFPTPFPWGGDDLHLWLTISSPAGSPVFGVDAILDGFYEQFSGANQLQNGAQFGSMTLYRRTVSPVFLEQVWVHGGPIIGLLGPTALAPRQPLLEVLGSAWSGHGLHVRLASAPGSTAASIWVGNWSGVPLPVGPCDFLLGAGAQPVGLVTDAAGLAAFQMLVPVGFLHLQLGLQATLLTQSGVIMSNGLRVTIGGGL